MLFSIDGLDFTQCIKMGTYQVNKVDVYNEWSDGFGMNHHDIYRKRIQGSFEMYFVNESDYEDFLNYVEVNKTAGGYLPVTLFINNTNDWENDVNVYLTMELKNEIPYIGMGKYSGFTVNIVQR